MQDIVVGLLAVVVGGLFCLRGYLAMRALIPLWGALAGFLFGARLMDSATNDGFLGSAAGWLVGLGCALVFAALAYLYYEVSVLLAMGAIGFALGTSLMIALGVRWSWVILLAGLAAATVLALIAVFADVPGLLLVVLSATGGASAVVFGLMLLTGVVDTAQLDQGVTTQRIDDDWWWYTTYLGLVVVGIAMQISDAAQLGRSMREQWASSGGRQLSSE